jgi:hypothetical protein
MAVRAQLLESRPTLTDDDGSSATAAAAGSFAGAQTDPDLNPDSITGRDPEMEEFSKQIPAGFFSQGS